MSLLHRREGIDPAVVACWSAEVAPVSVIASVWRKPDGSYHGVVSLGLRPTEAAPVHSLLLTVSVGPRAEVVTAATEAALTELLGSLRRVVDMAEGDRAQTRRLAALLGGEE